MGGQSYYWAGLRLLSTGRGLSYYWAGLRLLLGGAKEGFVGSRDAISPGPRLMEY